MHHFNRTTRRIRESLSSTVYHLSVSSSLYFTLSASSLSPVSLNGCESKSSLISPFFLHCYLLTWSLVFNDNTLPSLPVIPAVDAFLCMVPHSLPFYEEKNNNNLFLPLFLSSPGFHCNTVFGMESGKISDEQISASSTFYDGRWLPRMARLNNEDNAWTPAEDSNKEYIQVTILQTPLSLHHTPWALGLSSLPGVLMHGEPYKISNRCVMDDGALQEHTHSSFLQHHPF